MALSSLLKEYRSKLNLDGSAFVLVPDEDVKTAVEEVCKASYLNYLPVITVAQPEGDAEKWQYKEEEFTHIIAKVGSLDKPSLQRLKWIQWSLKYKGIALLELGDSIGSDQAEIIDFIEYASFERGRIRVVEQKAGGISKLFVIAMKWDLLCA